MIPTDSFEYLKEHIGCKWSIAEFQKHLRKWSKAPVLTADDCYNGLINCCAQLPNEIILESDYKDLEKYKNKENQDNAERILQEQGAGYFITSHKGKSDYIWFRFKTIKPITPALRLEIIRHMAKPGLQFDENFKYAGQYVRAVPGRTHWKHSKHDEDVIKVVDGNDLDIDLLGIKEPPRTQVTKTYSGSLPQDKQKDLGAVRGWANSISIVRLAKKYNCEQCHICNTPFIFRDSHGLYYCPSCKYGGGLKQFALMITKLRQVKQ